MYRTGSFVHQQGNDDDSVVADSAVGAAEREKPSRQPGTQPTLLVGVAVMMSLFLAKLVLLCFRVSAVDAAPLYDRAPFWSLISVALTIFVSVIFFFFLWLHQGDLFRMPREYYLTLWLTFYVHCAVSFYVDDGGGNSAGMILLLAHFAGGPLRMPISLQWATVIFSVMLLVMISVDQAMTQLGFRRFKQDVDLFLLFWNIATAIAGACFTSVGCTKHLKLQQDSLADQVEFIKTVVGTLSNGLHTGAAVDLIFERQQQDADCEIAKALEILINVLNGIKPYIPTTILQPIDQDFDVDDDHTKMTKQTSLSHVENPTFPLMSRLLGSQDLLLANLRKRRCTVMYVAVSNFTTSDTPLAISIATRLCEAVVNRTFHNDGFVDILSPSLIVATFNCHVPCSVRHAKMAVLTAVQIVADLSQYEDFQVTIALDTDDNFGGTCGVSARRAEVVSGTSFDLVQKLAALASMLRCSIVVTENTKLEMGDGFDAVPIDQVAPKWIQQDRSSMVMVYEVKGLCKRSQAHNTDLVNAFSHFAKGDLQKAVGLLEGCFQRDARDFQAWRLLALSRQFLAGNVPFPVPYVRRETGWECTPAELMIINDIALSAELDYVEVKHQSPADLPILPDIHDDKLTVSLPTDPLPGQITLSQNSAASPLKAEFHTTSGIESAMEALHQQQSERLVPDNGGLFEMFVPVEDDNSKDFEMGSNPANFLLSDLVPRKFEDTFKEVWLRSENPIGAGGFSTVYRALGIQGSLAAAKCFLLSSKNVRVSELQNEVTLLSDMRHMNIVAYVSCALTPSYFILIMEYVSGGSLRDLVQQFGPPPIQAVRRYLSDILRGLKYLHDRKVVHCDLKPHNALLSNDGIVKLSDFGSSLNSQNLRQSMQSSQNETEDNVLLRGTAWYMAPEAARNEISTASDVWSLGITVLELLTGQLPWKGFKGNEAQFIYRLAREDSMIPEIPECVPLNAAEFARQCLQRDPSKRPTIAQLQLSPFVTG